ncbi:hypothetical protein GPECTOR_42g775 [Gonium pectorale]|uniref:Uncharacterized protein n=1 Tax=Gonium pectorale TaxID=33097 RepID=A0A150G9N9_GONPE|nr:hypothetical protein GPECTOR_42g775 [Gonium pectorale]|eukprot:KXZ46566.1 hypothetical protein GPECTOR_42g775 [Gonium pectorale]
MRIRARPEAGLLRPAYCLAVCPADSSWAGQAAGRRPGKAFGAPVLHWGSWPAPNQTYYEGPTPAMLHRLAPSVFKSGVIGRSSSTIWTEIMEAWVWDGAAEGRKV